MGTTHEKRIEKLRRFYRRRKRLPSYAEMMALFDVRSKNAVWRIMQKLNEGEWVQKDSRGKWVPGKRLSTVKVLGEIQAGWPSPAEEELVDTISLDNYLIENQQSTFLLRVSGRSMIGAGIMPGDLVLVERGRTPQLNDIVIARVDDEYTLKRYFKSGGRVALAPENPEFETIYPESELMIEGVVVGVVRKYS
jgi:repressor LexA